MSRRTTVIATENARPARGVTVARTETTASTRPRELRGRGLDFAPRRAGAGASLAGAAAGGAAVAATGCAAGTAGGAAAGWGGAAAATGATAGGGDVNAGWGALAFTAFVTAGVPVQVKAQPGVATGAGGVQDCGGAVKKVGLAIDGAACGEGVPEAGGCGAGTGGGGAGGAPESS